MSDGEKILLIAYHSVNPVKYTSLEEREQQKKIKRYVHLVTLYNMCIVTNTVIILLIASIPKFVEDLGIMITLLMIHLFMGCIIIIKSYSTRKISILNEQFKPQMKNIRIMFFILILIYAFLSLSYYLMLLFIETNILLILAEVCLILVCILIVIESVYINL